MRLLFLVLFAASLLWGADAASEQNPARKNQAHANFEAGERAVRAGDSLQAYRFFSRAVELEPTNRIYAARKQALESGGRLTQSPATLSLPPAKTDPAIETVESNLIESGVIESSQIEEAPATLLPPHLTPKPGRQSFQLRGDAVTLWTMVADAFGLKVLFDATYQPLPTLRLDLTDVDFDEAFRTLQAASDSFAVPASEHSVLIARETAQNRAALVPVVAMATPIPERLSLQEAQEISTAIQQTLEIRRITLDPVKRVVYFRDTYSKTLIAREMFEQLSQPRAQVEVEVEFLEVAKTSTLDYGFNNGLVPPSGSPVIDFGILGAVSAASGSTQPASGFTTPAPPTGFTGFGTVGGGNSRIGLGITDSTLFAAVAEASTKTLLRSTVVALDGFPATMHVGDHYPVLTSSFTTVNGSAAQNQGLTGGVEFVDLGLVLKITPAIHEEGEVTLDVSAAFKTLGTTGINGIPIIGNREYTGKVRLKSGEWAVIAGLVNKADLPTVTGIPGLMQIPLLGGLFSQRTHEVDSTETLVILKPRIVNLPAWEHVFQPLWTGTETRPATIF